MQKEKENMVESVMNYLEHIDKVYSKNFSQTFMLALSMFIVRDDPIESFITGILTILDEAGY